MPNPAEGVAGSGNTSLLQPTFELDGLRVQCPMEPSVEQPAARSVSTRPSAASATGERRLVPPVSNSRSSNPQVARAPGGHEVAARRRGRDLLAARPSRPRRNLPAVEWVQIILAALVGLGVGGWWQRRHASQEAALQRAHTSTEAKAVREHATAEARATRRLSSCELIPFLLFAINQIAASHSSRPIGESSKMEPTLTENWRLQLWHFQMRRVVR
jgi:hypothetical protein